MKGGLRIRAGTGTRTVLTPDGLFAHDRATGVCLFVPEIKSARWVKPLYAQIAVTSKCNLSCPWCYVTPGGAEFDQNELKKLIAFLDQWGVLGIAFGGGEPLLYPHLTDAVRWTWKNTGLDVSITTNGSLPKLVKALEGSVGEVRISLYGHRSARLLKEFVGRDFEVGANLLLFRSGGGELRALVKEALDAGVNDFLINDFRAVGRGEALSGMEPGDADIKALAGIIDELKGLATATVKVSTRLAERLKKAGFAPLPVPFSEERPGRIIAVTADKRVKLSSLSARSMRYEDPEEIPRIYAHLCESVEHEA